MLRLKHLYLTVAVIFFMLMGYRAASAYMVARAVTAPGAPLALVAKNAVHPRFEMATPHRNLFQEIKLSIVPPVEACGYGVNCTQEEAKANCTGCAPGYCHCPGCTTSGCTVYMCAYTGKQKICNFRFGTAPCTACEDDYSNSQCNPVQ